MKITILCENECGCSGALKCHAEWGLSLYIESAAGKILFDLDHTGIYTYNVAHLEIDFQKENPAYLFPMHCVGFPAMSHFHQKMGVTKKGSGDTIEIAD